MRKLINSIVIFISLNSFCQNDTKIITSREKVPLQAVIELESNNVLYAGQEYTFTITTSGQYDLLLTAKNAKIKLIEESKKSTGGLRYSVTPIEIGQCSISIGNVIDENSNISLSMRTYRVTNFPVPPLQINGLETSQIISSLKDSTVLQCAYPKETGIYETYEIKSWSATIGGKTFSGNGNLLSEDLIQYVNQSKNAFLHLQVLLKENNTKHLSSETIYLIRQSEKKD